MGLSTYIPTLRGWLALSLALADGAIVPLLVPAYDAPRPRGFNWGIAALLAAGTVVTCLRSFRGPRMADRIAALLTVLFAIWMFYVFLRGTA